MLLGDTCNWDCRFCVVKTSRKLAPPNPMEPENTAQAIASWGDLKAVDTLVHLGLDVFSHNIETVKRLQRIVRDPRAGYEQSMSVLRHAKLSKEGMITKSSIMLGFGETDDELKEALADLRAIDVDILTLGQYLQPTPLHLTVKEYVRPEKFAFWKEYGKSTGFHYVASRPLVRSSYRAGSSSLRPWSKKRPARLLLRPIDRSPVFDSKLPCLILDVYLCLLSDMR
ncbi:hypothetical protein PTKIN_Ptkin02bG0138600 [Pterospermum kingtungense]